MNTRRDAILPCKINPAVLCMDRVICNVAPLRSLGSEWRHSKLLGCWIELLSKPLIKLSRRRRPGKSFSVDFCPPHLCPSVASRVEHWLWKTAGVGPEIVRWKLSLVLRSKILYNTTIFFSSCCMTRSSLTRQKSLQHLQGMVLSLSYARKRTKKHPKGRIIRTVKQSKLAFRKKHLSKFPWSFGWKQYCLRRRIRGSNGKNLTAVVWVAGGGLVRFIPVWSWVLIRSCCHDKLGSWARLDR